MSLECSECERDLRGGHDPSCSRYRPPCCDQRDEEGCHIHDRPTQASQPERPSPGDRPPPDEAGPKVFRRNDTPETRAMWNDIESVAKGPLETAEVAAIRQRWARVTPGPWGPMNDGPQPRGMWEPWQAHMEPRPGGLTIASPHNTEPICRVSGYLQPVTANAQAIASAPEDIAFLLGALQVSRALTEALRAAAPQPDTRRDGLLSAEEVALGNLWHAIANELGHGTIARRIDEYAEACVRAAAPQPDTVEGKGAAFWYGEALHYAEMVEEREAAYQRAIRRAAALQPELIAELPDAISRLTASLAFAETHRSNQVTVGPADLAAVLALLRLRAAPQPDEATLIERACRTYDMGRARDFDNEIPAYKQAMREEFTPVVREIIRALWAAAPGAEPSEEQKALVAALPPDETVYRGLSEEQGGSALYVFNRWREAGFDVERSFLAAMRHLGADLASDRVRPGASPPDEELLRLYAHGRAYKGDAGEVYPLRPYETYAWPGDGSEFEHRTTLAGLRAVLRAYTVDRVGPGASPPSWPDPKGIAHNEMVKGLAMLKDAKLPAPTSETLKAVDGISVNGDVVSMPRETWVALCDEGTRLRAQFGASPPETQVHISAAELDRLWVEYDCDIDRGEDDWLVSRLIREIVRLRTTQPSVEAS